MTLAENDHYYLFLFVTEVEAKGNNVSYYVYKYV